MALHAPLHSPPLPHTHNHTPPPPPPLAAQVLYCNFCTQVVVAGCFTWFTEREEWGRLQHLDEWDWATLALVAASINWGANQLQQVGQERAGGWVGGRT